MISQSLDIKLWSPPFNSPKKWHVQGGIPPVTPFPALHMSLFRANKWGDQSLISKLWEIIQFRGRSFLAFRLFDRDIPPFYEHNKDKQHRLERTGWTEVWTGLWRPSVPSDIAFWSSDVGFSYHYMKHYMITKWKLDLNARRLAKLAKCLKIKSTS